MPKARKKYQLEATSRPRRVLSTEQTHPQNPQASISRPLKDSVSRYRYILRLQLREGPRRLLQKKVHRNGNVYPHQLY